MDHFEAEIMIVFPGQGSQYVGMGSDIYKEFPIVQQIYQKANDVLGYDLTKLSFEGPEDKLNKTRYTQPALLTHSIACLEAFKELSENQVSPSIASGHSLGEYSALVAAGALTFEDALKLVSKRGELMSEYGRGKMIAFPLDLDAVKSFVNRYYCGIGGCNLPEQIVVGGREEDLASIADYAKEHFGKRGTFLNTEGAFHTYLMVKAAEEYRPYLDKTELVKPQIKVLSNYTGEYHPFDPQQIKAALFFQLFNPVRWIWGMQRALKDGVKTVIEFGGGIGSGEGPASKRPNLGSITRKAFRDFGTEGTHVPIINAVTLKEAAGLVTA